MTATSIKTKAYLATDFTVIFCGFSLNTPKSSSDVLNDILTLDTKPNLQDQQKYTFMSF